MDQIIRKCKKDFKMQEGETAFYKGENYELTLTEYKGDFFISAVSEVSENHGLDIDDYWELFA